MNKFTKLFTNPIKSLDEKLRQAEYIISTDDVDRCGEIVEQTWELDNYKKNPIVLFGHDPSKADNVLGKCIKFETEKDGEHTVTKATVQFAEEGTSSTVDTVWKLVKQGILRTVSVGFIPHAFKNENNMDEPTVLSNNELLEFSLVPLPANPNAVALAYGDGSITEKDAKFLIKNYKKEVDLLEKSLCDTIKKTETSNKEGNAMSDEDISKLAEAVGTAVSEALTPKLDEILSKVSEDEGDDEEPADEKPADEEPVDGGDQLSDGEEKPDEDEDEDDENDDKEPKKNAKSEQKDEDGAFDENEELDEAAEKSFLAELEKEYQEQNI